MTPEPTPSLDDLIVGMNEQGTIASVWRRLESGDDPAALLAECRTGIERVGRLYEQEVYFISALILAGEIFQEAADILVPRLEPQSPSSRSCKMVIATVRGDIHDIGKNIVVALLDAQGFEMVDLGVNVPAEEIADAVVQECPDVLGLSSLLTTGYATMRSTIELVRERTATWEHPLPIVIGGAPTDQVACDEVGADAWCDDAACRLEIVRSLCARPKGPRA
jgi:methylmalonyl-CoA mutase cobalamin-binding domain/chain